MTSLADKIAVAQITADFLIVDKPAGWLTIPSRQGDTDPRPILVAVLQEQYDRLFVVHRLDAEVSGLILFARNAAAHRQACQWFERRQVQKTYEAWTVHGPAAGSSVMGQQRWESRIARGKKRAYAADFGKDCVTLAQYLGVVGQPPHLAHRWQLQPLTGRSHQLRYEMAAHGMPILGDRLYGCTTSWGQGEIALRAIALDFQMCSANLGCITTEVRSDAWLGKFD